MSQGETLSPTSRLEGSATRGGLAAGAIAAALTLLAILAAPDAAARCETPQVKHEPPCNPALPASPWGASHRSSYAQGSAAVAGIVPRARVHTRHIQLPGAPIVLEFSDSYDDGGRAVWGSLINSPDRRGVFKVDHETGKLIDVYFPDEREANPPVSSPGSITGSYNLLTREGRFIVPRQRDIEVFADSTVGRAGSRKRRLSPIRLVTRFQVPSEAFCRADDSFVGATMTHDGKLALVTAQGMIVIVPRKPKLMTPDRLRVLSINGDACANPSIPSSALEQVSNSIAADEAGGIYVVTSSLMRKIRWDRRTTRLRSVWSAPYRTGGGGGDIRLGAGSGSTPSLMGTAEDEKENRFVAITDGEDVMHLDLFYRDGIPRSAKRAKPGNPRLACEHRVDFGRRGTALVNSEQSVLVRGHAAVVVNNALRGAPIGADVPGVLRNALAALYGGDARYAPHGVERIDWVPRKRGCKTRWASRASIPNGVPTMSQRAGLFYGIGLRNGRFGVRALDFATGRNRMFAAAPSKRCPTANLDPLVEPFLAPALAATPNYCENSFYAATEVGPDRTIYTGTFGGLTIYRAAGPKG